MEEFRNELVSTIFYDNNKCCKLYLQNNWYITFFKLFLKIICHTKFFYLNKRSNMQFRLMLFNLRIPQSDSDSSKACSIDQITMQVRKLMFFARVPISVPAKDLAFKCYISTTFIDVVHKHNLSWPQSHCCKKCNKTK